DRPARPRDRRAARPGARLRGGEAAVGRRGDGGAGDGCGRPGGGAGGAAAGSPVIRRAPDTLRNRLIFALDVDRLAEAERLVQLLAPEVGTFKVGKQLFLQSGPEVVRMVHRHARDVFLDLKFHDIPSTVAKAGVEAARLRVRSSDVHASGSPAMMTRTRAEVARACRREGLRRPRILAVTVLTSLARRDLRLVGVDDDVEDQVVRLARLAR